LISLRYLEMVKSSILVAQISDSHLSADPEQKFREINPHENLKCLMRKVTAVQPDLILASGDLSEDGSRESYSLLQRYLHVDATPVIALPGNHDDAERLAEVFPDSPVETISVSRHGGWQIIRLNSCLPGKAEGCLAGRALADLESVLADGMERPRLIALHHQPVSTGSPWIDKYPLLDAEKFLTLVDGSPDVKAVVWGHVHQVFARERNGTAMLGGPSSAINGIPGAQKFTADTTGPAFRWLKLAADGSIQTGITLADS
jgi:Icc protein